MKFKKGDYIYYRKQDDGTFDTFPGIVLSVKKYIKIKYNGFQKDIISYVKSESLSLQKESK